ncbi:MAG: hypothetical protein ACJ746_27835 [Bryobacteraceae bacterium]
MVIRIRLRTRQSIVDLQSQVALAFAALFAPCALLAFTICIWSFAAELGLVGQFYVTAGIFSHWQVWLCLAAILLLGARLLGNYGAAHPELTSERNSNFHNANPHFAEE